MRGENRTSAPYACGMFLSRSRASAAIRRRIERHLPYHGRRDSARLLEEGDQQMLRRHLGVIQLGRQVLRGDDRFLRLFGEFVQVHDSRGLRTTGFSLRACRSAARSPEFEAVSSHAALFFLAASPCSFASASQCSRSAADSCAGSCTSTRA